MPVLAGGLHENSLHDNHKLSEKARTRACDGSVLESGGPPEGAECLTLSNAVNVSILTNPGAGTPANP